MRVYYINHLGLKQGLELHYSLMKVLMLKFVLVPGIIICQVILFQTLRVKVAHLDFS